MWFVPSLQIFMTAGSEICFFAAILFRTNCVQSYVYMNILHFQTSKIWTTFSQNLRAIVIVIQFPNSWYNMCIYIYSHSMYPDVLGPSCCYYASMPVEVHSAITIDDDQRAGVSHSSYCMCEAQASRFRGSKDEFWNNPIWWLQKGITVPLVSCRFHLCFASPMCWGQKHWRRLSDQQPCLPSLLFLCFASLPLWGGGASGDGTWVAYSCHFSGASFGFPLMFIDSLLGSLDKFGHKDCHKMDDQGQPVTLMGAVTFKSLLGLVCS